MQRRECMPHLLCMRTLVRVGATGGANGTFMADGRAPDACGALFLSRSGALARVWVRRERASSLFHIPSVSCSRAASAQRPGGFGVGTFFADVVDSTRVTLEDVM